MTFIMNYSQGDIVLLPYPFTDLSAQKVRPALIIGNTSSKYTDLFIVPLTSQIQNLQAGEFVLQHWKASGLNVTTAVKRGCVLIDTALIRMKIGILSDEDLATAQKSLKFWVDL